MRLGQKSEENISWRSTNSVSVCRRVRAANLKQDSFCLGEGYWRLWLAALPSSLWSLSGHWQQWGSEIGWSKSGLKRDPSLNHLHGSYLTHLHLSSHISHWNISQHFKGRDGKIRSSRLSPATKWVQGQPGKCETHTNNTHTHTIINFCEQLSPLRTWYSREKVHRNILCTRRNIYMENERTYL